MRGALAVSLTVFAWAPAGAGELIFANGNRLAGELSNEALMVSTGSGLVEIAPDEVASLSREEIRLRDGRVIRGTLVGGQIKARTSLGEIAVKVDDLQAYQGSAQAAEPLAGSGHPAPPRSAASTGAPVSPATPSATPVAVSSARSDTGIAGGLPTMAAYQRQGGGTPPASLQTATLTPESQVTRPSRMFEIIGESPLYRDALYSSSRIGRVVPGQQVMYVDSIDRRLRILNLLVFDGGHWVKIRLADGTEGWVPADSLREVR